MSSSDNPSERLGSDDPGITALANILISALAGSDSEGNSLPAGFAHLQQTLAYNEDGTLHTITVTNGTNNWTQTIGYTNGKPTSFSAWVKS